MTDELTEAIEMWYEAEAGSDGLILGYEKKVYAAARAYAEGRQFMWCEVHLAEYYDGASGCVLWLFAKVVASRYGTEDPRPCKVEGPMRLCAERRES